MTEKTPRRYLPPDPKGEFPFEVPLFLINLMVAIGTAREAAVEKALAPHELSVARYRSLVNISRLGDCSMKELAVMTGIDRSTLTRVIDQLIEHGLVARAEDAADRRRVLLSITEAGRAKLAGAEAVVQEIGRKSLENIPEDTQRAMVEGLRAMLASFGDRSDELAAVLRPRLED
jgi:DNA-binding MarR family transcriptional regulator